ncbi:hypothetical protein SDC9_135232 [bioreactor metagenome]|uniref:Uncharacterized protein n=1 Tax=bioreactor metagenome TaxID=1076179 RepID=A0A645DFW2_9ZZZZ
MGWHLISGVQLRILPFCETMVDISQSSFFPTIAALNISMFKTEDPDGLARRISDIDWLGSECHFQLKALPVFSVYLSAVAIQGFDFETSRIRSKCTLGFAMLSPGGAERRNCIRDNG